jgi:hypothetical protein
MGLAVNGPNAHGQSTCVTTGISERGPFSFCGNAGSMAVAVSHSPSTIHHI